MDSGIDELRLHNDRLESSPLGNISEWGLEKLDFYSEMPTKSTGAVGFSFLIAPFSLSK